MGFPVAAVVGPVVAAVVCPVVAAVVGPAAVVAPQVRDPHRLALFREVGLRACHRACRRGLRS